MVGLSRFRGNKDLLSQVHDDFNRMLAPFNLRSELAWPESNASDWVPSMDIKETEKDIILHADLPGVEVKDIDVNLENGILTIKGKRQSEHKEEKDNVLRMERSYGSFMRQFNIAENIDEQNIKAKCTDGVLELVLPKAKQGEKRKITIQDK